MWMFFLRQLFRFFFPTARPPARVWGMAHFRPRVEELEPIMAPATITWTGAGPDSLASDPLNWAGGVVPGPNDVAIAASGSGGSKNMVVDPAFTSTLAGLEWGPAYTGTITLEENLTITGNFSMDAGVITGSNNLTLDGVSTWDGGTMSGTGTTTVANGATLTLGSSGETLDQRALTVAAQGIVNAGSLVAADAAPITNDGTYNLQGNNQNIAAGAGNAPSFINNGTLSKLGSGGADVSQVSIPFTNNGTVQAQTGILSFTSTLTQNNPNAVLNVAAGAEIRGGTMNISLGTLQGAGTFRVTGNGSQLTWGGTAQMNGTGQVVVDPGATMLLPSGLVDNGFTISNSGTTTWTGGIIGLNSGSIANRPGGVFDVQTNGTIVGGAGAAFNNSGTFQQIVGPGGVTSIQVPFNSVTVPNNPQAQVNIQLGTLQLTQGGQFQGNLNAGTSGTPPTQAVIELSGAGQTYTLLNTTTVTGAGLVQVDSGATVTVPQGATATSSTTFKLGGLTPAQRAAYALAVAQAIGLGLNPPAPPPPSSGTLLGPGQFTNLAGGTVLWAAGNISNMWSFLNQGTLNISAGVPTLTLDSSILQDQGTVNWTAGNIDMAAQANGNVPSQIQVSGIFNMAAGLTLAQDPVNPGLNLVVGTGATLNETPGNGMATFQVQVVVYGTVSLAGLEMFFQGSLTENTGGIVEMANGALTTNAFNMNGGTLNLGFNGQASFSAFGGLSIPGGATLTGLGTITGSVTNAGTIDDGQVGLPTGQLSITGDYTQTATGTLRLFLQAAQNQQYDQLRVGGTATLAGNLTITAPVGFAPNANDQFTVLTYGQHVRDFSNYDYSGAVLPQGRTWGQRQLNNNNVTLVVQ
jgi:fibronectin-binding autotransporter adhesin